MDEKTFPNWMLIAIVFGLGELTYWLFTHYGAGVATKLSFALTVLAAVFVLVVYAIRFRKKSNEKLENMTD